MAQPTTPQTALFEGLVSLAQEASDGDLIIVPVTHPVNIDALDRRLKSWVTVSGGRIRKITLRLDPGMIYAEVTARKQVP